MGLPSRRWNSRTGKSENIYSLKVEQNPLKLIQTSQCCNKLLEWVSVFHEPAYYRLWAWLLMRYSTSLPGRATRYKHPRVGWVHAEAGTFSHLLLGEEKHRKKKLFQEKQGLLGKSLMGKIARCEWTCALLLNVLAAGRRGRAAYHAFFPSFVLQCTCKWQGMFSMEDASDVDDSLMNNSLLKKIQNFFF